MTALNWLSCSLQVCSDSQDTVSTTVVIIKHDKQSQPYSMASGIGYIIACKELIKTDTVHIGHGVMLASVIVVDLLCTKYAVLMNKMCC